MSEDYAKAIENYENLLTKYHRDLHLLESENAKLKDENKKYERWVKEDEIKSLQAENKKLRDYVHFNEMRAEVNMPLATYKVYMDNVKKLADELEESLKDDPEWEKIDGKWRPKE